MSEFILKLIGSGTADVESFGSYMARTTVAYNQPVTILLECFVSAARETGFIDDWQDSRGTSYASFCKNTSTTKGVVEYLSAGTGEDFRQGTAWFITDYFSYSAKDIYGSARWCPDCFKEMRLAGVEPHLKLLWSLTGIRYCPSHKVALVDACKECGNKLTGSFYNNPLDHCQFCDSDLSEQDTFSEDSESSWENSGGDVICFLQDVVQNPNISPLENRHYECLRNLMLTSAYMLVKTDYYHDERTKLLHETYLEILKGKKLSFLKLRRLAYLHQFRLYDFVSGQLDKSAANLDFGYETELPQSLKPIPRELQNDYWELLRKIHDYLNKSTDSPRLVDVARYFDVSVGKLQYRYPALVKQLGVNRKRYMQDRKLKKYQHCKALAYDFFYESSIKNHLKSRKKAIAHIREETGYGKFFVREVVQEVYDGYMLEA